MNPKFKFNYKNLDMGNIFGNVKFGDRFKTRDGRTAIFSAESNGTYSLITEGSSFTWAYNPNGELISGIDKGMDIVSRIDIVEIEREENPRYCYICGKKPCYEVGDTIAEYVDYGKYGDYGEYEEVYGEIVSVKYDEELCDWNYEIKNKGEEVELYTEQELCDNDVYKKIKN